MRKHAVKFASLIAFTLAVIIFVFPQRAAADQDDPPTRIARLSHVDGSVSFEPAGTDEWVTPVVNRPMTTGDKLWADHDSRAELHLGSASIRLGASTGFSFLNLDDNTVQLQVTEGTLRIRVRHLDRDENFEIDTPNLAFSVLRPGIYRINVNEAGDSTVVVVRDGEGEVTGGGQSYVVRSDETGIFTGTDQLNADIEGVGDEDPAERCFFFSSRRRHTRSLCDWSSDVCSSDLDPVAVFGRKHRAGVEAHAERGDVGAQLLRGWRELAARMALGEIGVRDVSGVAIRKPEMHAGPGCMVQLVGWNVVAHEVAPVVGEPQLLRLRVPAETDPARHFPH